MRPASDASSGRPGTGFQTSTVGDTFVSVQGVGSAVKKRPCTCGNTQVGSYQPGSCYLCWLALNVAAYSTLWGEPPPECPQEPLSKTRPAATTADPPAPGWGDRVEAALKAVGVTPEKVSAWLGRPCNCAERKKRLNALGRWADRVLGRRKSDA